ncbi:MAG TPA: hypothetical protein VFV43_10555, partial [Limnobacter sp.]|nr:hypothetical protein [Limnobacter sp.]
MSIRKILWPSLEFAAFVLALLSSLFAMGAWTYAEFTKTDLRGWTNFSIWTALVYHILAWSGLSQSRVFLAVLRGDELSRRREWALRSLMYVPLLLLVFGLAVQLLADYQAGYFGHVQATLLLGSVTVFTIYLVFRDTNRII